PNLDKQLQADEAQLSKFKQPTKPGKTINADTAAAVKTKISNLEKDKAIIDSQKRLSDTLYSKAAKLVGTDINSLNSTLAIGWQGNCLCDYLASITLTMVIGWLLTALAISLGAPF